MSCLGIYEQMEMERQRKERERAEIKAQIDELNEKLTKAKSLVNDFKNSNINIKKCITQWADAHSAYTSNEMASTVMVTDRFEGDAAEKLALELSEAVKDMQSCEERMSATEQEVGSQIEKLQEYIQKLQQKISDLWDRYYSI